MNTASLEGILISHFSAGKMKRMPNKLAAFNSKKASQEWEKGKTIAALQMLGEVIKEILTNGDTAVRTLLKVTMMQGGYVPTTCSSPNRIPYIEFAT